MNFILLHKFSLFYTILDIFHNFFHIFTKKKSSFKKCSGHISSSSRMNDSRALCVKVTEMATRGRVPYNNNTVVKRTFMAS